MPRVLSSAWAGLPLPCQLLLSQDSSVSTWGMGTDQGPFPALNIFRRLKPPAHMFSTKGRASYLQAIEIVLPLPLRARLTPLSRPVTSCFRKQGKRSCSSAVTPSPVGHILAPCCPAIRHCALVLCVWCFLGGKPSCVLNAPVYCVWIRKPARWPLGSEP